MIKRIVPLLAACGWVLTTLSAHADYSNHEAARAFVDKMATEHDMDREWLQRLMVAAERKQSIIDAMERAPERTKTWKEYRPIFVTDKRIARGVEFWQLNKTTLARAEETFGVPAGIIVAIIGVETYYGRHTGGYRVLDALATLAFDYPKRSRFFTSELEQFLILVREQGFEATQLEGSYAGAMGFGQFISSSYRRYAVDFDDDGTADILNNVVDAIGSVANYLKVHGWERGQPIVTRAELSDDYDQSVLKESIKPTRTLAELETLGYSSVHVKDKSLVASPFLLKGQWGDEVWLGLKNFYVITRYNHSNKYAKAVFDLYWAIKQERVKALAADSAKQ